MSPVRIMKAGLWRLLTAGLAAVSFALATTAPVAAQEMDEYTRAALAYELTMPKLEAYAKTLEDMGVWAKKNPAEAKRMRNRKPSKSAPSLDEEAMQMEKVPGLKEVLDRNGLSWKDVVLIPLALVSGVGAQMMEQRGIEPPAGRINPSALALARANPVQLEALSLRIGAARQVLSGK